MNYLEGALQGFLWGSYCAALAILLRVAVFPQLTSRNSRLMLASIIRTLLIGGGLWLAVGCVATSLCSVAALGYTWLEAGVGLAAMLATLGLAYELLYDYVRVKA